MTTPYLLLFLDRGRVCAADATDLLQAGEFPDSLQAGVHRYQRVTDEDTFVFWDELRDQSDRTVGYTFCLPESKSFRDAWLFTEAVNATREDAEVEIFLQECTDPVRECVQGFGSELYRNPAESRDCLFLMFDWSENPKAFDFQNGPEGESVVLV
jgi:hypothetical protein